MTTKAEFNAEEWEQIASGPAIAGLIVVAAQRGGTLRETIAMAKAYGEEREHHTTELIGELASTPPKVDRKEFSSAEDLRTRGLGKITEAVGALEAKATPEEVDAYRAFSLAVAQRAAEADKSGGVLGIGGERVSDAERTALNDVAAALGADPPSEPAAPSETTGPSEPRLVARVSAGVAGPRTHHRDSYVPGT